MPVLERVTPEDALARIQSAVGSQITSSKLNFSNVELVCPPGALVDVVRTLRDLEGIRCEFFTFLSAIDYTEFGGAESDRNGGLEVLVHLYSPDHVVHVNIHVPVDLADPVCPSITDLFQGALWHERETHEMFGIDFEGHPRLVNLYLPEDFNGNPGRRSFKLPSRSVKDWPGAKDPEEAAGGGR